MFNSKITRKECYFYPISNRTKAIKESDGFEHRQVVQSSRFNYKVKRALVGAKTLNLQKHQQTTIYKVFIFGRKQRNK